MNEQNPNLPPFPTQTAANLPPPPINGPRPLGDDPTEREPIPNILVTIESVLRQPRRLMFQLRQPGAGKLIAAMFFVTIVCSLIYGVIIGSFSGGMQWWAAPVKVTAGLLIATIICLPSLYIFTCLSATHRNLRSRRGTPHADDDSTDRLRSGGVVVFTIHKSSRMDGIPASDVLGYRHSVWPALPQSRILARASALRRWTQHLGIHLRAGGAANDHCATTHRRHVRQIHDQ